MAQDDYDRLREQRPALFHNGAAPYRILLGHNERAEAETAQASRLAAGGLPAEWARTGLVFEDQYQMIIRDAVLFPDQSLGTYIRAVGRNDGRAGVAILPRLAGLYVIQRHFRHATRRWHWEIPRGYIDDGESEERAAERELHEEVGLKPTALERLGHVEPDTGLLRGSVALFLAECFGTPRPAPEEAIDQLLHVSAGDLLRMISAGDLTDGFTLSAIAQAVARGVLT